MPDLDKVSPSSMTAKKKVVTINGVDTEVDDIRSVQLNEKIGENVYQILHPETDAYQVITDPERRFVSEEEKAKWNQAFNLGATALHYCGKYNYGTKYYTYDVVYLEGGAHDESTTYPIPNKTGVQGRRFFIYVNDAEAAQPGKAGVEANAPKYDDFITEYGTGKWVNINFESYLAEYANNIYVDPTTSSEAYTFAITKWDNSGKQYRTLATSNNFTINPVTKKFTLGSGAEQIVLDGSTGTITAKEFVGDLKGTADSAKRATTTEQYVTYSRTEDGTLTNNTRTETGSKYVDDAIVGLDKRIDAITDGTGGAVLSNKLVINKNGASLNGEGFDGRESQSVNITFNPHEITDLLDDKDKIQEKWLPETILGAMNYIGTFDASTGNLIVDLREPEGREFRKGDYAIAVKGGNLDPSGAHHASDTEEVTYFILGDWAVFNGRATVDTDDNTPDIELWTKIDNTDAVRTVNGQIGDVKTYKGAWVGGRQYYQGDMVEAGTPAAIYVCIRDNNASEFSETNFKICGRIYQAADGIELTQENNTFRHTFKNSQTVNANSTDTALKLKQGDTIAVSLVEMNDKYGHVSKNTITYYEMPDDTWRPVWVNGEVFKGTATTTGPLDISHDFRTNTDRDPRVIVSTRNGEPNKVIVGHVDALNGAGSHTSQVLEHPLADGQVKIGLGSQFTTPNIKWNASGHIDEYSTTTFELPTDLIQHKHFNVALVDGRSTIRSFTAEEFIDLADKNRKFYDAGNNGSFVTPDSNAVMGFFGQLRANGFYQLTRNYKNGSSIVDNALYRAVDESVSIFSGRNLRGAEINGYYNANTNYIALGDSGVHDFDTPVVYSAVAVNKKGITVAGGQILEFGRGQEVDGQWVSEDPSDALVIGGLFFRDLGPKKDTNGAAV